MLRNSLEPPLDGDVWHMLDAGAFKPSGFSDCGFPSTFGCGLNELLAIYRTLRSNLAAVGAKWIVFEIADGVRQQETALLLGSRAFTKSVDQFVYAAAGSVSAVGRLARLRAWGISYLVASRLAATWTNSPWTLGMLALPKRRLSFRHSRPLLSTSNSRL